MSIFQKKVYKIVRTIPKGKVMTYSQVAKKAGNQKAYRAVGNILNKSKGLPCHRVIRKDGSLGGYRRGVKKKVSLLLKEGVVVRNRKIVI